MSTGADFLLVIPAYKESERLPRYLAELSRELDQQRISAAILVVDDGSGTEETAAMLEKIEPVIRSASNILPPLCLPENQGKGGAILAGWNTNHSARWLAFADADGATSASEVARMFQLALHEQQPRRCYFAARVRMLGRSVQRSFPRHISGRTFATLVGLLIHPGVYDSQCGCKLVSAQAFAAIRHLITEKRFAFDVELLTALLETGFDIREVPVDWHDVAGSKVSFLRDIPDMFRCVLRVRAKREKWRAAARHAALREDHLDGCQRAKLS